MIKLFNYRTIQTIFSILVGLNFVNPTRAQIPAMEWHRGFGTEKEEHVHEGWQTSDGGYIGVGDNGEGTEEYTNVLVVKSDNKGDQEWLVELGTDGQWDVGICVKETAGGYIVGGGFYNNDTGHQDRGLVKLDFDGNIIWQKTYAGNGANAIRGIDINTDGSIIATGYTNASEYGYIFIIEEGEGFVMKTDADGSLIWDEPISSPQGTKVRIEKDGNLAIVSTKWVWSNGNDHQDVVLIKTDADGKETFVKNYGGDHWDQCFDFDLTLDGGYILTGHTLSYGVANWDYFVLKIDANGNEEWARTFGQPRGYNPRWIHDESYAVRATFDGGYIICGGSGDEYAYSADGHPSGGSDEWKAYLVKLDGNGQLLWEAVYPSESVGNNAGEFIALTDDGGYVIFTDTDSAFPPEPNNFGFMKITPDRVTESQFFELSLTITGEGSVYPMNKFQPKDSSLTLDATPDQDWEFDRWSGDLTGTENPVSFVMDSDKSIHVKFSESETVLRLKKANSTRVYPNPVTDDKLFIEFPESPSKIDIELIDLTGRVILTKSFTAARNGPLLIQLSKINQGIYFLQLESQNRTFITRIIIE
jgi:hypothetical protein